MSTPPTPRESSSRETGDEFNLIAVLNVIVKRKLLFLSVFLVILLLGVLVALTRTPQNSYVSVLQIGAAYGSNSVSGKLVEDTDGVVTKIQRSVIPQVVSAWVAEHPDQVVPQMIIKGKRSAGIVLIMTRGGENQASEIAELHRSVTGKIIEEHKTLVMTQYESFMSEARKDLVGSESQIRQIRVSLERNKERKKLLGQQLERLNGEIATLSAARQGGVEQKSGEQNPSALYLVPPDLPTLLEHRDTLEDELTIKQDLILAELQRNLSNAESNRVAATKKIDLLKNEIDSLRLTRVQTLAAAMPDKVGLSPKLVMIFSLVLGLLAAWFVVMFAEYWQRQLHRGAAQ